MSWRKPTHTVVNLSLGQQVGPLVNTFACHREITSRAYNLKIRELHGPTGDGRDPVGTMPPFIDFKGLITPWDGALPMVRLAERGFPHSITDSFRDVLGLKGRGSSLP